MTITRTCDWVIANYLDNEKIPDPQVEGEFIDLRGLLLDALLIKYRRCFGPGQRTPIPNECVNEALGELKDVHVQEIMARASKSTAHAVHASSASVLYVVNGLITYAHSRPGTNRFDFENIRALSERWLIYLRKKISQDERTYLTLSDGSEEDGSEVFVFPWGANVDIQAARSGSPQKKLNAKLKKQTLTPKSPY